MSVIIIVQVSWLFVGMFVLDATGYSQSFVRVYGSRDVYTWISKFLERHNKRARSVLTESLHIIGMVDAGIMSQTALKLSPYESASGEQLSHAMDEYN